MNRGGSRRRVQGEGPSSPDLTFCFLIKLLFYVSSCTLKILIFQYSSLLQVYKIKKSEALEAARPIGAGAYPGFCSMKRLEVFLLPLDGILVHRRSLPRKLIRWYPFIHLGGERYCESKVSCLRTQHNVPGQGSNPERLLRSRAR